MGSSVRSTVETAIDSMEGKIILSGLPLVHGIAVCCVGDERKVLSAKPYPDYRKVRNEMQQLTKAQKNMELYFAEDKDNLRPQHTR